MYVQMCLCVYISISINQVRSEHFDYSSNLCKQFSFEIFFFLRKREEIGEEKGYNGNFSSMYQVIYIH